MADEKPAATPASDVVEEARSSAAGTRTTARWIASALGSIPSLTILAAIVRVPGDDGFDETKLAIGLALAALGLVVGVGAFAYVLSPDRVKEKDLEDLDLRRIPGQPFENYKTLGDHLKPLRDAEVEDRFSASRALQQAKGTDAEAAVLEGQATEMEAAAKKDPTLQDQAIQARARATAKREEANAAAARAAAASAGHEAWSEQLARAEAIRRDAYLLKASDEVDSRYKTALVALVLSVGLIAAGIFYLGTAPKPKEKEAAAAKTTLVTLKPNAAGQRALGCTATSVQALRVGGTDAAPVVITLPSANCPAKTLTFKPTPPKDLGAITTEKAVAPSAEATGQIVAIIQAGSSDAGPTAQPTGRGTVNWGRSASGKRTVGTMMHRRQSRRARPKGYGLEGGDGSCESSDAGRGSATLDALPVE